MKWYCIVNELKEDAVKEYKEAHLNMYKTKWSNQLDVLKQAGAKECLVFINKNQSILFYRCEDIDESFTTLGTIPNRTLWDEFALPMFANNAKFDGSEKVETCELVFDLNEQLHKKAK
jgi:L-rhamnose mutarotase